MSALTESQPVLVKETDFNNCIIGIRNSAVTGATIIENNFNMGDRPASYIGDLIGICFENEISGFTCQENDFNTSFGSLGFHIGIFTDNTGSFSKEIRKNSFDGMDIGNFTEGDNGLPIGNIVRGLNFLCNLNSNLDQNGFDFLTGGQVRVDQGRPNSNSVNGHDATGNTFSYTGTDFDNSTGTDIDYFFDMASTNQTPTPANSVGINAIDVDENACPSEIRFPPDPSEIPGIVNEYYTTESAYNLLLANNPNPTGSVVDTLSEYRYRMDTASYAVVLYTQFDTTTYTVDSLYTWIQNSASFEGDLWLAREYLANSDPVTAQQVLANIPNRFNLATEQQTDLNNYVALTSLIDTFSIYTLDSATLATIQPYDQVGQHTEEWAQRILTYYGAHYPIEYTLPSQGSQGLVKNTGNEILYNVETVNTVLVFPNPSKDEVNFKFGAINPILDGLLVVFDLYGREVDSFQIGQKQQSVIWDASDQPKGFYFFNLYSSGPPISSGTLVIDR